jgi:hypothetical protein
LNVVIILADKHNRFVQGFQSFLFFNAHFKSHGSPKQAVSFELFYTLAGSANFSQPSATWVA